MKIAFITGGSKGLGKAFVDLLGREGFTVREFSRSGAEKSTVICDFSKPLEAARTVEQCFAEFADSDFEEILLINNVGTLTPIGPTKDFSPESLIANVNINLTSTITTTGLFSRFFQDKEAKKSIISVSSGAASKGRSGWSLYCATKAGLEMFVRSYAKEQETEKRPIQSLLYNPGVMETEMQTEIREANPTLFPEHKRFVDLKTNGHLVDPALVAASAYTHYKNQSEVFSFLTYA